ncbi:sugar transferase [Agromyces italicus]|uniref:sugar transferase n=1 Tax=Agromyces italicus TaxID=279572 RepID=UPI0003B45928|nr:sugar transferase [Agromyces italicus]
MYRSIIKRAADVLLAIALLPLLGVAAAVIAIAIKLDDRGPVFYRSNRLGLHMREFSMFKFRTMHVAAPDIRNPDGSTFNASTDSRVTRLGRFLRGSSLDELPQIINVLRGEMSFIGPRPSPLGNEHTYSDAFRQKFRVRPGLTGLSQAKLRNRATRDDRIRLDTYYVENVSLKLDLQIVFTTIKTVARAENVNQN